MSRILPFILTLLFIPGLITPGLAAAGEAPWGKAQVETRDYQPSKVVYDVAASSRQQFERVLDRVSYLSKVYHEDSFAASIVVVLHGDEIPYFGIENQLKYRELMERAQGMTLNNVIEFRMCKIAAQGHGFEPQDIHGFVKMVPMADAEIVRLQQQEGYAYMQ
jgi:intracellular sulfur oxidation DsrE/DsrF family protein